MKKVADDNPNAQVLVRAVKFRWRAVAHLAADAGRGFRVERFAGRRRNRYGQALSLVAEQLKMPPMSERALPPVLVLISDGQPTDDLDKGIKDLLDQPWNRLCASPSPWAGRRHGGAAKIHRTP
ncbi:MAG: hypothetical protein WKF30_08285 [Pyrinomonadaceae bacterium]